MPNRFALRGLALGALAAASLASPTPAFAGLVQTAPCDGAVLTQPFSRWGDTAPYKLVPGGDAEKPVAGWAYAGGAKRVSGSEPYAATGKLGAWSFSLPAGGSITTASTCVNAGYPSFRFFVRSSGGLLGLLPALKVDVVYRDGLLGLVAIPVGTVLPASSWRPSPVMLTLSAVGAAVAGGQVPMSVRFTSLAGTWQVDDVFVDPLRRS